MMNRIEEYALARPKETKFTLIGIGIGFLLGLLLGGIGIAAKGGAIGLPAALVLAVILGLVGNRIGVAGDQSSQG